MRATASRFIQQLNIARFMPSWLRSSAIQQGIMLVAIFLSSLVLMAMLTYAYVDHQLDDMEHDITEQSKTSLQVGQQGYVDGDDIIDSDEMLTVLSTGFGIAGVLVSIIIGLIMAAISRRSQLKIARIEQVLISAAEGDLSVRTGVKYGHNDLTRIARSVDDMLDRLQATVAAMGDISANIAHELKTPISRLRHNLIQLDEHLNEQAVTDEAMQQQLDKALRDSQRITDTFDALLRISQIESGARRSRFTQVDINQILALVDDIYVDVAEDAQMTLTISPLTEQPLNVLGDKELLTQLLINLVENAIRYCPVQSQIILQAKMVRLEQQTVVRIRLDDNGPGIAKEHIERVFERLYRVDKSRTDGGLGLGLSLAKAVVQLHHGHIRLYDNMPGLGVEIDIPIGERG